MSDFPQYVFKVVIVGDMCVGKTSLMLRFCDNIYTEHPLHTVGLSSKNKIICVGGSKIKIIVWDTAGQERYRTLTLSYYRGAAGIMLLYDVTNEDTFNVLTQWLQDIERNTKVDSSQMIVGNKTDLGSHRAVAMERGKKFAESHDLDHVEISCKDGSNVEEAFILLVKRIKRRLQLSVSQAIPEEITLQPEPEEEKKKFKFCSC